MKTKERDEIKFKKLIEGHIQKYWPMLAAIEKVYGKQIRVITDKGTTQERQYENFYLCPLCIKHFIFVGGDDIFFNDDFDMDHFPPKSVGGKQSILECKTCNSTRGHEIDHSIKQVLHHQAFEDKELPYDSVISLKGLKSQFRVSLSVKSETEFTITDHQPNSFLGGQLLAQAKKGQIPKMPFSIIIKQKRAKEEHLRKALLKAGYLWFFKVMGYEFALSHSGCMIREVIQGSRNHVLKDYGVLYKLECGDFEDGLYMLVIDGEYRCFGVMITAGIKGASKKMRHMVIMPGKASDAWDNMKALEKVERTMECTFEFVSINETVVKYLGDLPYSKATRLLMKI